VNTKPSKKVDPAWASGFQMTGQRLTRPGVQTATSWLHNRQAEAVASAQKEQKEPPAASGGSCLRHSSQWTSPVSLGASLGSGRDLNDISLDQSCPHRRCDVSSHQRPAASLLPPTPDHSWVDQDVAHSNDFRAADRKDDSILCGRCYRHRSLRGSDHNGTRLLLALLDLLLRCRG
jgi:hypothetical protein